jgi:hypothetical protein
MSRTLIKQLQTADSVTAWNFLLQQNWIKIIFWKAFENLKSQCFPNFLDPIKLDYTKYIGLKKTLAILL